MLPNVLWAQYTGVNQGGDGGGTCTPPSKGCPPTKKIIKNVYIYT